MDFTYLIINLVHDISDSAVKTLIEQIQNEEKQLKIFRADSEKIKLLLSGTQNDIYIEQALVLTDDAEAAKACETLKIACMVMLHENNKNQSFPNSLYCMENPYGADLNGTVMKLETDIDYMDKVFQRAKQIPWEIASTDNLIIREITVADVKRLYELYEAPSVTRYMESLFTPIEKEEEYTRQYIQNIYGFYGYGMWVIVLKETGEVIGRVGIESKESIESTDFDVLELGFMLGEEYQHKGYAFEACQAVIRYAKDELENTNIIAVVHKDNLASQKLCERLGFRSSRQYDSEFILYKINR